MFECPFNSRKNVKYCLFNNPITAFVDDCRHLCTVSAKLAQVFRKGGVRDGLFCELVLDCSLNAKQRAMCGERLEVGHRGLLVLWGKPYPAY